MAMPPPPAFDCVRFDDKSAADVVARYSVGLLALARRHLPDRVRPRFGPEDVVQSVYRTFFARCRDGRLAVPAGADLWNLLAVITLRKCHNRRSHAVAARRDVRREGVWPDREDDLPGRTPDPGDVAELADVVARLTAGLPDLPRRVVELTLTGEPTERISATLGCPERTVRRVRARFRDDLMAALGDDG